MLSPRSMITRLGRPAPIALLARPVPIAPPLGRCAVCGNEVRAADESMTLRGGLHVHRTCATYRTRQRARLG
jgi:hypothetical protein